MWWCDKKITTISSPGFSPTRPYGVREWDPGDVSFRIWEITNKWFWEGADKCEIFWPAVKHTGHWYIDTGRYDNIPRDERLCNLCDCNRIEDETHFLLDCPSFSLIRDMLFSKLEPKIPFLRLQSHESLLSHLMNSTDYFININNSFIYINLLWIERQTYLRNN